MNRFGFHVQMSQGRWGRQPYSSAVRTQVYQCAERDFRLSGFRFCPPETEEILREFKAEFCVPHPFYATDAEYVRDTLIMALLGWFQPEYESMIEVEVMLDD